MMQIKLKKKIALRYMCVILKQIRRKKNEHLGQIHVMVVEIYILKLFFKIVNVLLAEELNIKAHIAKQKESNEKLLGKMYC